MKFIRIQRMAVAGSAAVLVAAGVCPPADAWGPVSRSSMVTAAAHVLGQDPAFTLTRLSRYVTLGADLPQDEFDQLHPLYRVDPVGAIQREMVLLQSMRGGRIDPYYAFRLGSLGRMVADATAPLAAGGNGALRERYYGDVEKAIGRAGLEMEPRKVVDPRPYFSFVQARASSNNQIIEIEYRSGDGFDGIAHAALPADASRSVNAVADVWYTVLTSRAAAFEEPDAAKRDYVLGAIAFYLKHKNSAEAEASYASAQELGLMDINLRKTIGDLFFEHGRYERSIVEYRKILADNPGRRDVIERVARYYEITGDDALKLDKLEAAREAYGKALEADKLHSDAQRKMLNVEAKLYARDERLVAQRTSIEQARALENRAEEAADRRDYARAIALLRDAEARYAEVTDEFPLEAKDASTGRRTMSMRTKEIKQQLIDNSASLSGSSAAYDARQLAGKNTTLGQDALKKMLQSEYTGAVRALGSQMDQAKP